MSKRTCIVCAGKPPPKNGIADLCEEHAEALRRAGAPIRFLHGYDAQGRKQVAPSTNYPKRSSAPVVPARRATSDNGCLYQLLGAAVFVVVAVALLLVLTGGLK